LDFVLDGRKRTDILYHFLGPLTDRQVEEYGNLKDQFFWRAASDVGPVPGVFEFVECIRGGGIAIAVATSAGAGRARSILARMGLLTRFNAIVTGNEVRDGKPDPGIYRLACQRINCLPEAAVAVEDAVSGIRAAKAAGLKCVGMAGHQSEEKLTATGADCVIRDFVGLSLRDFHFLVGM
jgi:beta-phosphoglucomutase